MNDFHSEWPARPWLMAIFLSLAALAFHLAIDDLNATDPNDRLRLALAAFICVSALSLAFTLERLRWHWSATFSVAAGLIMAGIAYWNAPGGGPYRFEPSWSLWSGLIAVMIAAPMFQNVRDEGRFNLVYEKLHNYSWTDVVIFFTSLFFVGITFMLMHLLASLLDLIGLGFLRDLLNEEWFGWMLAGVAFGAALGILRESDRLLIILQKLVLNILSVLAPILATGLALFLISLPFTGLEPLWESTRNTTPILLSCAIGALILSNAIIRNHASEITNSKILKISAMFLAITVLPLTLLAVYSMWLRLDQYGLTPDRIWGFIVVWVGVIYGLAYLISVILKQTNWAEFIRPMNIKLAGGLCLLALFLALPIFNFGEMSAQNQLARLNDGRTPAEKFDFMAMAFDFGPVGRKILEKLKTSSDKDLALGAQKALEAENRWAVNNVINEGMSREKIEQLVILPETVSLPEDLTDFLHKQGACRGDYCVLKWEPESDQAFLISQNCHTTNQSSGFDCGVQIRRLKKYDNGWSEIYGNYGYMDFSEESKSRRTHEDAAAKQGPFTIREITRKQIFAGDTPIGEPFE